jgi:DUF438 domain-containing protein
MNIVSELEHLISRLGSREQKELVCQQAREFLDSVEPEALHDAERQLMAKGVPLEKLHKLCAIHLELLEEKSNGPAVSTLNFDIIDVLYHEHEIILDLLEEMESIGHALQVREISEFSDREMARLPKLIESLKNVESHRKREEQVVYAELERAKVKCSQRVLTAEHQRLREEMEELLQLVGSNVTDLERLRQKVVLSIGLIVPLWWRHIFKENNILFPAFIERVTDEEHLMELKSLCDQIGYAGFDISVTHSRE